MIEQLELTDLFSLSPADVGSAKTGQSAVFLCRIAGGTAKEAAQSAYALMDDALAALPANGNYTACVSMVRDGRSYYLAFVLTIIEAGTTDNSGDVETGGEDDDIPNPGYHESGTNSYTITQSGGLMELAKTKSAKELAATSITLDCNITLTADWPSVASYSATFDGQGHTVTFQGQREQGMFASVAAGGTVTNLTAENVSISGGANVAALVGYNDGTVSDCIVTGTVSATGTQAGGIAGTNSGTIRDCSSDVTVEATSYAGGIAGLADSGSSITGCQVKGTIKSSDSAVGGIAGTNRGTIQNCESEASVQGLAFVGGIAGSTENGAQISYSKVVNSPSIRGVNDVGGIVGSNDGKLTACSAECSVVATDDPYTEQRNGIGGVAGGNSYNGVITGCYAKGTITGSDHTGGIVGRISSAVANHNYVIGCYFQGSVTGTGSDVGGAFGKILNSKDCPEAYIACYWSGSVSNPSNSYGIKVTGEENNTWKEATEAMNDACNNLYNASNGEPPTL